MSTPSPDPHVMAVLDSLSSAIWQQWVVPFVLAALPVLGILYGSAFFRWWKNHKK